MTGKKNLRSAFESPPISVLIIHPRHDIATYWSNAVAYQIYDMLNDNDLISIDRLGGLMVNSHSIRQRIGSKKYDLILYFGHGKPNSLYDGLFNIKLDRETIGKLGDTIFYAMACYTADEFGEMMVKNGLKSYIGNTQVVYGAYNTIYRDFATDFARIWQTEVMMLLSGVNVAQAVNKTRGNWYKLAEFYRENYGKDPVGTINARNSMINGRYHVYFGNGDAKLPTVLNRYEGWDQNALNKKFSLFSAFEINNKPRKPKINERLSFFPHFERGD